MVQISPKFYDKRIEDLVTWNELWKDLWIEKLSKWWIYVSEATALAQKQVWENTDNTLNNPWEQKESTKTPLFKYMDVDTNWWKNPENVSNSSRRITEVKESPDEKSSQIMYSNWEEVITHQLHHQTKWLMSTLSTPEEYLTKLFGLTQDQFMKKWKLKMWEWIKFTNEQKNKIQQLLQSQVLQLAGCRDAVGRFNYQGRYGYLWTSIPWVYFKFGEDEVCVDSNGSPSCSFSAIRPEN